MAANSSMKTPSFAKKMIDSSKERAKRIAEKLDGENYLYMGDPMLQWGTGGWVRGRANLVYGPKGSGKSSLCLKGAAEEYKKTQGYVIIFDSEYSYIDPREEDAQGNPTDGAVKTRERLAKVGLDWEMVLIVQSNEVDKLFEFISEVEDSLKENPNYVSAMIVDSWGGIQGETQKKQIREGEVSKVGNAFGGNAKAIGPIITHLLRIAAEHGVTQFWVQHVMNNMDQYGPKYLLLGGNKLQLMPHMILFVEGSSSKDSRLLEGDVAASKGDDVMAAVGKKILFRVEKSRNVVEGRKGEFWMNFEDLNFAQASQSLFNLASKIGVITHPKTLIVQEKGSEKGQPILDKDGNKQYKTNDRWWQFPEDAPTPLKWNGSAQAIDAISKDKDLFNGIWQECLKSKAQAATTEQVSSVAKPDSDDE